MEPVQAVGRWLVPDGEQGRNTFGILYPIIMRFALPPAAVVFVLTEHSSTSHSRGWWPPGCDVWRGTIGPFRPVAAWLRGIRSSLEPLNRLAATPS